jgi:hypothetical protein
MFARKLRDGLLATAAAGALVLTWGTGAHAASISSLLYGITLFEDNSAEEQNVDTNGNALLDVDDTLRGILKIQGLQDGTGGGGPTHNIASAGTGNNELAAVFEVQVATKTANGNFLDPDGSCLGDPQCDGVGSVLNGDEKTLYDFTFTSNAAFGVEFGTAGAMVVFFEDTAHEWTLASATGGGVACTTTGSGGDCEKNVIENAVSGALSPVLVLGFNGSAGEFWTATNALDDPTFLIGQPDSLVFGGFNVGASVLFSVYPVILLPGSDALGSGSIHGNANLLGTPLTVYDATDDVDFTMAFRVPEPATLGIMGIGLLGLGAISRRRKRAA